jgi:hypothetical protein
MVSGGNTDTTYRENRILSLGLPAEKTKALYLRYKIPLPK